MKPRVAHVVESMEVGGAEKLVYDLVCQRGSESTSVICLEHIGVLGKALRSSGFRVDFVNLVPNPVLNLYRARRCLRNLRPDVLHCHNLTAHFYAGVGARLAGDIPVICTKHGSLAAPSGVTAPVQHWLARRTQFVAVSSNAMRMLNAWTPPGAKPVRYIPNGISLADYQNPPSRQEARKALGWPADAFLIAMVARLAITKGHLLMLDTFARMLPSLPPGATLLIVGDGVYRPEVAARIHALQLEERALLLGERQDVPQILAAADVFCLPSELEGMPITLLEAMAASLPVVISNVGAIPDVVEEGVTGLLIPPFNSAELARALLAVAADPLRAAAMGRLGKERLLREYTLEKSAAAYEQLYEELMQ